ncbi:MAG: O-antigen ligase family protein [bacterium]
MAKKKRKGQQQLPESQTSLPTLMEIGLCLLIFYPPFFRGLFFARELLPTHIFSFVLFGLWWYYRRQRQEEIFFRHPLDYITFGFVIAYLLSIIGAANVRSAISEFLKVGNYFIIYYLVSDLIKKRQHIILFLRIIMAGALCVALLGLGAAAGTWQYTGAFAGGRIASSLQYPNTLAVYLTTALMLSLGFWLSAAQNRDLAVYGASSYIFLLTFIFTQSRGALLVLPFALIILWVFMPRGYKLILCGYLLVLFAVTGITAPMVSRAIAQDAGGYIWLAVLLGVLLMIFSNLLFTVLAKQPLKRKLISGIAVLLLTAVAGGFYVAQAIKAPIQMGRELGRGNSWTTIEENISNLQPEKEYTLRAEIRAAVQGEDIPYAWRIIVAAIDEDGSRTNLVESRGGATEGWESQEISFTTPADFAAISIRLQNYYEGTFVSYRNLTVIDQETAVARELTFARSKLLPTEVVNRLSRVSLDETNVRHRLIWWGDAWEIIKDYPILGAGGGGWQELYHQYQDYLYWSTEVHNHWLQVGVETGFLGLTIFISIWLFFIYTSVKVYLHADTWVKITSAAIGAAVVNLGLHSFIDFNLSLAAVSIVLWSLFGIGLSLARIDGVDKLKTHTRKSNRTTTIVLVITLVFTIVTSSLYLGYSLGQRAANAANEGRIQQARKLYYQATRFDPFTASYYLDLGQIEALLGELSAAEAAALLEKGVSLEPNNPSYNLTFGQLLIQQGEFDRGLDYVSRSVEGEPYNIQNWENLARAQITVAQSLIEAGEQEKAEELLLKVTRLPLDLDKQANQTPERLHDLVSRPLSITPRLALSLGQAHYLLHNHATAIEYLEEAAQDKNLVQEAEEWLETVINEFGHD